MAAARVALVSAVLVLAAILWTQEAHAKCVGKFANPITDICWSCIFPIKFGPHSVFSSNQEDFDSGSDDMFCSCSNPPRLGISISFWEPARMAEVTRTPYCFVALGGLDLDPGVAAREPTANRGSAGDSHSTGFSFYHVHWYVNPVLYWLEVLLDFDCLERQGLDIAYLTELDPLWGDDQLAAILAPESVLTANTAAVAACAADCVSATSGFPRPELFWCAGCQGLMYPLNGNVHAHISGRQASALLAQRMAKKMHRELSTWYAHGKSGMCGYWLDPRFDKRAYKFSMIYPKPQTAKIAGRCCQPLGRATSYWGAGREWPVTGEDFVYMMFRKRDCCSGGFGFQH